MQHNKRSKMSLVSSLSVALALFLVASGTRAVLVQPYNYLLDDSSMVGRHDHLSPFLNQDQADEAEAEEQSSRSGRSLQDADQEQQLSPEMAELLQESHQAHGAKEGESLSASVANMLLNAAHAAAQASADEAAGASESNQQSEQSDGNQRPSVGARGILELDTSNQQAAPTPSKSDLKPIQWYNPKETIPVLKISSMATPSKYKKVYFRSEKKLVDGAFHSPSGEQEERKSLKSAFAAPPQRRSSRGTGSSSSPPSYLQNGLIDFIKNFHDVYMQTRPAGGPASSSAGSFASNLMAAAGSSPIASVLAPSGSRPNLSSAFSAASSMVSAAGQLAQAASSPAATSGSASVSSGAAVPAAAAGAAGAAKPMVGQQYVSFWTKTFPTWVRRLLKQMRRRALINNKNRQHHAQHSAIGQATQGAVASVVESVSGSGSSGHSSSGSS